jgi:predicted nucleic acid-binding protein
VTRRLYLADTSAFAQAVRNELVDKRLHNLARSRSLATCVTVDLEMGYATKTPAEHAELRRDRELIFVDLPIITEVCDRARDIQALMVRTSQHRSAGVIDVLTAAVADHYGATVLHHDTDFDHIAAVTGQPMEWVVAR